MDSRIFDYSHFIWLKKMDEKLKKTNLWLYDTNPKDFEQLVRYKKIINDNNLFEQRERLLGVMNHFINEEISLITFLRNLELINGIIVFSLKEFKPNPICSGFSTIISNLYTDINVEYLNLYDETINIESEINLEDILISVKRAVQEIDNFMI